MLRQFCLSVCPSVTLVYCVEMANYVIKRSLSHRLRALSFCSYLKPTNEMANIGMLA